MNKELSYWEQQKDGKWKDLIKPLKDNPEVTSRLDNLITTFYWKFREKKGKPQGTYNPEINFNGFTSFEDYPEEGKMGHCELEIKIKYQKTSDGQMVEGSEKYQGTMWISLNQKLLLDKMGMDKWFSSENSFLPVGFDELIETIAHELAHAYQNTVRIDNGEEVKSQCESTGDKNNYPELVAEHTSLTSEIESMIKSSSEYQSFKDWWNIDREQKEEQTSKINNKLDTILYKCRECSKDIREGDRMYRDYDGNKYCESCGQKRKQEFKESQLKTCDGCKKKVPATELFLGNHRWATDDVGKNLCGSCYKKAEEKQKEKVQEINQNIDKTQKIPCPGGCGRRIKRGAICSNKDCIRRRGYYYLDEPNLKLIQCVECGTLRNDSWDWSSLSMYCNNCKKSTLWKKVKLDFEQTGEYQIIDHSEKPKSSFFSSGIFWIISGTLGAILIGIIVYWLLKKSKRE